MKFLLPILIVISASLAKDRIKPVLTVHDSSYSIEFKFPTTLSDSNLYEVLFKYDHVEKYVKKSVLTTDLIRSDSLTNRINFHYNYLVAHLDMQVDRKIDHKERSITFAMHNYERSGKVIPEVKHASGHYSIVEKDGRKYVHYQQKTSVGTSINRMYEKIILRENRHFLESLIAYIREREEIHPPSLAVSTM